jgi:hypothetical protein
VVVESLSELTVTNGKNGHEERPPEDTVSATTVTTASGSAVTAEAGHLAGLVRELTESLADQRALTALWMERARVLGDQLALAAPVTRQEPNGATLDAPTAVQGPKPSTFVGCHEPGGPSAASAMRCGGPSPPCC